MATSTEAEQAKEEMEKARVEVMESEREIQTIKMALRQVASEGEQNSLKISAIKVRTAREINSSFTFQHTPPDGKSPQIN